MKRVAIYTRLSHDPDGSSTATARQEQDCRQLAESRGWAVSSVYQDNDTSAFQRKVRRPEFERLITDLLADELDVVIAWRSDRLVRQPRDLERFLDACESRKASFMSCTEPEFAGSSGLLILRMLVAFANHESGVKSERVARKCKERAEVGLPPTGGGRMFGYDATGMHLVPAEAGLIRAAARRIIAGESIGSIIDEWNVAAVAQPKGGKRWTVSNVRRCFTSPRLCGLRAYQGQILGPGGQWPQILDEATWKRFQVALERPKQAKRSKYLLSGLLRCGRCGAVLHGARRGRPVREVYSCPPKRAGGCQGVAIKADFADLEVVERVLHRLGSADLDAVIAGTHTDGTELLTQLRDDEASLEQLAKDHYVEELLSRPEYLAAKAGLDERLEVTRRALNKASSPLSALPRGEDQLRAAWTKRAVPWRRAVLSAAVEEIVVQSAGRSPKLDPNRIQVRWRA